MFIGTSLQRRQAIMSAAVALLAIGCHGGSKGGDNGGGSGGSSTFVTIDSTLIQSGFARGSLRQDRTLPAYQIIKEPVTWAEFNACVQAGRCAPADRSACPQDAYRGYPGFKLLPYGEVADNVPATCVGESQADSFCHALGGRLPTLDEWLLAARGPAPARFSWGDTAITGDQHPLGDELSARLAETAPSAPAYDLSTPPTGTAADLTVGMHPAGASPMGIADVLLAPAELLAVDREGLFGACAITGDHCVVFGLVPGSIDAVEPFYALPASAAPKPGAAKPTVIPHAYAFRCVLDDVATSEVMP